MRNLTTSQRKFWVMTATICSLGMIFFDASALPIALPSMQKQLHLSASGVHWIINAYLLVLAVLILLGGKLADRFGSKGLFILGMSIFTLSSLTCALAHSESSLIISRIFQGIGGALLVPTGSPLFRSVVTPEEFGKLTGMYLSLSSLFLILGPTLGGVMVEYLSWRWIFWINLPTAIFSSAIIYLVIPPNHFKLVTEKFDWAGFITLSIFLVSLVFALMQGSSWGWSNPTILGCFLASLISGFLFIWIELKQASPYVHIELFRLSHFSNCILMLLIMQIVFVTGIFFALFLQYTHQLSPVEAGLVLLTMQLPVVIFSNLAGYLLDRWGPRLPATIGSVSAFLSCLWIALFANSPGIGWLLPGFFLFGFSIPLTNLSLIVTCISSAAPERRGIASAITHTVRQVGASVGLAIFSTIIVGFSNYYFNHWLSKARLLAQPGVSIENILAKHSSAMAQWHQLAMQSYSRGFAYAMLVAAGLCALAVLISWRLPKTNIFSSDT